jgi:hypothetical protein
MVIKSEVSTKQLVGSTEALFQHTNFVDAKGLIAICLLA